MTSAVAMGMTTDVTNMSRYPSLWVMPHRDRVVTVAPLCGSEFQAAGRDGSNSVQYLGADSYAGALFQEGGGKRF